MTHRTAERFHVTHLITRGRIGLTSPDSDQRGQRHVVRVAASAE